VAVLKHEKELRVQGLHTDAINERLAGITFGEVDTSSQQATEAAQASQEALQLPALKDVCAVSL
jgi:hypothetical protein